MTGTWPAREPCAPLLGKSAPGLSRAPLVQSPVGGAKIAQAAAGRRSSNIATRQRRARRVNNRKPFSFSSEAFAGMRITYRHQKEAQPEGQHDDIQHEMLLVALISGRDGCAFREGRLRWIKSNKRLVAANCRVPRCHAACVVSRWVLRQRYRKVIKSVGRF
jgi:hypothetical protein